MIDFFFELKASSSDSLNTHQKNLRSHNKYLVILFIVEDLRPHNMISIYISQ